MRSAIWILLGAFAVVGCKKPIPSGSFKASHVESKENGGAHGDLPFKSTYEVTLTIPEGEKVVTLLMRDQETTPSQTWHTEIECTGTGSWSDSRERLNLDAMECKALNLPKDTKACKPIKVRNLLFKVDPAKKKFNAEKVTVEIDRGDKPETASCEPLGEKLQLVDAAFE